MDECSSVRSVGRRRVGAVILCRMRRKYRRAERFTIRSDSISASIAWAGGIRRIGFGRPPGRGANSRRRTGSGGAVVRRPDRFGCRQLDSTAIRIGPCRRWAAGRFGQQPTVEYRDNDCQQDFGSQRNRGHKSADPPVRKDKRDGSGGHPPGRNDGCDDAGDHNRSEDHNRSRNRTDD